MIVQFGSLKMHLILNFKICFCLNWLNFFRHGEKCAGVIAAVVNNSYCGVGLAYKARLGGNFKILSLGMHAQVTISVYTVIRHSSSLKVMLV